MIERFIIKSGSLYFDGKNSLSTKRSKAKYYTYKHDCVNIIKFLNKNYVLGQSLKIFKIIPKKNYTINLDHRPILNEDASIIDLSTQVVESFFAGEALHNEDAFYDKMVALSNHLNKCK